MSIFNVTITDPAHLAGVAAARAAYNAELPATIRQGEGDEAVEVQNPALIGSDADYVQFVMARAAESYARQYGVA